VSRISRVEMPGSLHLVEQRLFPALPARSWYHERGASLALLRYSLRGSGVSLCGYNLMPRRTLLVLIPNRPGAIGRVLAGADRLLADLFYRVHRRYTPLWEQRYDCCPFADTVAWSVLRYVDLATARGNQQPSGKAVLNSAAEHADGVSTWLTAPRDRLPPSEHWREWLNLPQDKTFVRALEMCLRTGKPLGPFPFVRQVEQQCHRRLRPACLTWPGIFDSAG
jgi:hypothetical protein